MPEKPDVLNRFAVSVHSSGQIVVLNPPLQPREVSTPLDNMRARHVVAPLSADDALNLAAWLVAVAHVSGGGAARAAFDRLLDAILKT